MYIYVASSWRNAYYAPVVNLLGSMGHQVYDFKQPAPGRSGFSWADVDEAWESWSVEQYRTALCSHPAALDGYRFDMEAMLRADACVMVMPCGRSSHLEAGWFCGRGKPCVVHYPQDSYDGPELMTAMATIITHGMAELKSVLGRDLS